MAKKKPLFNPNDLEKIEPEFKPGDKPHLEYDGQILNHNVPWGELVTDIQACGYTQGDIAQYAECKLSVVEEIANNNYDNLCFRSGARIVTMHHTKNPHMYNEF